MNAFFDFNGLIVTIVPLLFAVTCHEVAHGWVAYRLGDSTAKWQGRLTLNPLKHLDPMGSFFLPLMLVLVRSSVVFGYAKPVPVDFRNLRNPRRDTLLVSAAGVTVNFILAFVCGRLAQALLLVIPPYDTGSMWFGAASDLLLLLLHSVRINLILVIFNLIPVPPLDGGRILTTLLPPSLSAGLEKLERFGMIILVFLLFTGVVNSVFSIFLTPMLRLCLGAAGIPGLSEM